jgi:hypothetical protein
MNHEPMNKEILGSFMCNSDYFGNSYVYLRRVSYKGNHFATFAMWFIGAKFDYNTHLSPLFQKRKFTCLH